MRICGICRKKSLKNLPRDIFVDKIGNPPVLISELLTKIAAGINYQFASNEICRQCTNKMCQYYSANQLMEKIQTEILDYIKNEIHADFQVEAVYNYSEGSDNNNPAYVAQQLQTADNGNHTVGEYINNPLAGDNQKVVKIPPKNALKILIKPDLKSECTPLTDNADDYFVHCDVDLTLKPVQQENATETEPAIDCSKSIGVPTFRSTGKGKPTGIKCEYCDRVFENHKTFQAHKKYSGFSGYVCELCGTTLFSHSGFVTHTKSHQAEKEFQCPDCDAQFHRKAKLTHHMAWHKGEKPFQCEICAKCFVHRVALTKHRHIHSDVTRRNECKICGKKFRTLTHLTRHMAIHTGAKPFSCPICGKCFSQSYNMKSHIKQHETPRENNYKRLRCQKCLKSFARSTKYEEHIKICYS